MSEPFERPSLRKAADAGIHPSAPTPDDPRAGLRLGATSDAVGAPDKDKLVDLEVRVPKSLRKAIRAEAERREITLDELVAEALRKRPYH